MDEVGEVYFRVELGLDKGQVKFGLYKRIGQVYG